MKFFLIRLQACVVAMSLHAGLLAQKLEPLPPVRQATNGRLVYIADGRGDRVPDFSYCGYRAGEHPIPDVPIRVVVPVMPGDATLRIQAALDHVASLPLDKNGIRGAVLLQPGEYTVEGSLVINTSGVVLRGSGMHEGGTVLTGAGQGRETLIRMAGVNDLQAATPVSIANTYVPVNATTVRVGASHNLKAGDAVRIHRPSVKAWIDKLGMNEFGGETGWLGWKPGQRDLYWHRTITSVAGATITLDVPLTTALDTAYGGATIGACQWPGRITNAGVENLQCVSAYDKSNLKDEDHRWMAITIENTRDAWVRQVTFRHFAGSAVAVFESASRVTVEDCMSLHPISEIGAQRRYTFFTEGQQTLFQRLYSEYGYHDFAAGFCAAGPNAFVQCHAYLPYSFSGAIDSWTSGVLFDIVNIDGQALGFANRMQDGHGAGWTAANSMLWQCSAARIDCYKPPTANNWAFGAWALFSGDGYWSDPNNHVKPRSLYYAQLEDRLGQAQVQPRAHLLEIETEASSSPTVAQARALTEKAKTPLLSLKEWISQASQRQAIPVDAAGVKTIDNVGYKTPVPPPAAGSLAVANGWIVRGASVLTGSRQDVPWWRGDIRSFEAAKAKPHITRFVPGRTGRGLTDDLAVMTDDMKRNHTVAIDHNYGLWYERRRDDHERIRRMDGEVWPPFYELPFARSGKETAWDGLSKYDLTRYNPWYWSRLKQFTSLADQKGLVLLHQHYFQHNILEAGAHWADFPWRTANNTNDTGFPEPPPYAGDKRIFMDEYFYDISHPIRRALHRAYIRKCLDNFEGTNGVIHFIGAEYTGPLHFAQFWLDTIMAWERETGKNAIVAVSATKDVQDALLADAARASAIDVIDIRYWHYRDDGTTYAPQGGVHLAPRQHARLVKPGKQSFEQVYRAVVEYRQQYPAKGVIYSADHNPALDWAVFMAGGSLAAIPQVQHTAFAEEATAMVVMTPQANAGYAMLTNGEHASIIYSHADQLPALQGHGTYTARWVDPADGRIVAEIKKVKAAEVGRLKRPVPGPLVLWLSSK